MLQSQRANIHLIVESADVFPLGAFVT